MGSYLYKATGKEFDIIVDGAPRKARMMKFWMKPYWEQFEDAIHGRCSSWADSWEKKIFHKYCLQLGRLNKTPAVAVMVLSQHSSNNFPNLIKKPTEGDTVMIWGRDRHYVVDDPNYENAACKKLILSSAGWIAQ